MKVQFLLFPDEGEEPDHTLMFELPGVPQVGDCVTISHPGQEGCTNFIVRRTHWDLDHPGLGPSHRAGESVVGTASAVTVECEFAVGPYSSEEHKRTAPCAPRPGAG
ncbi:MAG: alpha/beta hydrolase [Rhodospirillaceae bacterium]|jgi:hypothetical protein|nr:alpha/beta hydrolase [Rhodospirillaceae bacterium]|tara:strand:- start:7628 stop:7948 length:321 start_codon:yes stop_codon:yes gene_type:complete